MRVVEKYGKENCIGVFADTGVEDEDNYRFLQESTKYLGIELFRVFRETLWDNWIRNNAIPNNRMAFCSRQLKQEPCRKWLAENSKSRTDILYVGIAWDEVHRIRHGCIAMDCLMLIVAVGVFALEWLNGNTSYGCYLMYMLYGKGKNKRCRTPRVKTAQL